MSHTAISLTLTLATPDVWINAGAIAIQTQTTLLIAVSSNAPQTLITMPILMSVCSTVQLLTTMPTLMAGSALPGVLTGLTINMLTQGQADAFKTVHKERGEIIQLTSVYKPALLVRLLKIQQVNA